MIKQKQTIKSFFVDFSQSYLLDTLFSFVLFFHLL